MTIRRRFPRFLLFLRRRFLLFPPSRLTPIRVHSSAKQSYNR